MQQPRGSVLISETPRLGRSPPCRPPASPANETEAGGWKDLGLRTPVNRKDPHPSPGRKGCLGPSFVPAEVPGTLQPWPGRSAPAAWPAGPHQCQLLTLVASARSSTIQRGSPSPHLAIGSPVAPPPAPEQPQPQPQDRADPAARQRLETTRSGRRTSSLAFPSTSPPPPPPRLNFRLLLPPTRCFRSASPDLNFCLF